MGGGEAPAVRERLDVNPQQRRTNHVPCCFISATASRPDRTVFDRCHAGPHRRLIPAVPVPCCRDPAVELRRGLNIARISPRVLLTAGGAESVSDSTPRSRRSLMTSAPYLTAYRTALRTSSTPVRHARLTPLHGRAHNGCSLRAVASGAADLTKGMPAATMRGP